MMRRTSRLLLAAAAIATSLILPRCSTGPTEPLAVPDPNLDGMEPQVAELLRRTREKLLDDRSADAWGDLGSVYDAHGLMVEAEACYAQAKRLDPRDFRWTYLLAVVREIQGADVPEIEALFGSAADLRADYAPIHVRLGDALSLRGEHAGAREAFAQAIRLAPESAVAHRGMGQVLLALGNAEEAVRHLSRAAELEPRDLTAHAGLAQALMRLGQPERAREAMQRAAELQPINAFDDPVYGAQVFMRSMSSSRAFARAQAAIRIGAYAQAIADLQVVLKARPEDASVYYWLGIAYQELGRVEPATRHLSRTVELEPGMVKARLQLGRLLLQQDRFAEAAEQYERAAALRPLNADGHYGLGQAYEGQGRTAEARGHYEAALRLDPNHAAANRLAETRR